jgi:ubiquinone/menaquinone biosynthesis C-methylase UbiE
MTSTTPIEAATQEPLDAARAEAFGGRVMEVLNHSLLGLAISVGHQTELFETLAQLPPSTSTEIASAAGLDERYVREWLAIMTVGGIVEYEAATGRYWLPREHAASLTRAAGPGNLASVTQVIALMAGVEADIVQAFRSGGGVGYERYARFSRFMREDSAQLYDVALIDVIVPVVEGLRGRLEAGISVADVGCGSGHAINILARAFPKSRFVGYDLLADAIGTARDEAKAWGLTNAEFRVHDVSELDVESEFDVMMAFDAIHDQAWPRKVLATIARALKPGGTFLMADIAASSKLEENLEHPMAAFGYGVSLFHCMTVSLAQGGEGLGTMWGTEKALELLAEAGFRNTELKQAEGDFFNNYFISTR